MDVIITIKQGPVFLQSLDGKGLNSEYNIWNDISAHEFFPKVAGSANYILSLRKKATHYDEVIGIENELIDTLIKLSEAWVFSGGSLMPIEGKKTAHSILYSSNAGEVRSELLKQVGLKSVTSDLNISYECGCTYTEAPLKNAIKICEASFIEPKIRQIVRYYSEAMLNNEKWFVDLYKVRDAIKSFYGGENKAIRNLGINKNEWSYFGSYLNNNDLRHPPQANSGPVKIDVSDKNKVKSLAWNWVMSFLKHEGIV